MKKFVYFSLVGFMTLVTISCTNQQTIRRVNALYDKVNTIQTSINTMELELKKLNDKILEIKGPPTADLATLQARIEQVNDQYRILAKEIAKVQGKIGMTPMDTTPPKAK